MPIGPVSPKDMGRAGRGTSSKSVSKSQMKAKSVGKAKIKGPTQAQVKGIRNKIKGAAWDEVMSYNFSPRSKAILTANEAKFATTFRGISKTPRRGTGNASQEYGFGASSVRKAGKGIPGSKLSKGKMPMTSNMQAKEGVKSGQLRRLQYSPTNSARQKPVPTKPSKPKVQKKTGRK